MDDRPREVFCFVEVQYPIPILAVSSKNGDGWDGVLWFSQATRMDWQGNTLFREARRILHLLDAEGMPSTYFLVI